MAALTCTSSSEPGRPRPPAETVTVRWQVTDGAGGRSRVRRARCGRDPGRRRVRRPTTHRRRRAGDRAPPARRGALPARAGPRGPVATGTSEAVVRGVAARRDRPLHRRRPAELRAVGHARPVLGGRHGTRVHAPADVVGGRFGDLVDPGPAWVGHVRRGDGVTHVRVDLDDIPADGPLPVRVRIGGTWLSADYLAAPSNPDGRLPLLDWAADTVTFSGPDPDGAPVEFDVGGRRVAEADAGGPGRARLLIAHFCIQAINDLLEEPFDGYAPPRTYMQVTMADERRPLLLAPGRRADQPRRLPRRADDAPPLRRALPPRAQRRRARAHRARLPGRPGRHARRPRRGPDAPGDRGLRVAPHPVLLGRGERPRHHGGRRGHHDLPRGRGAAARRVLPRPAALPAAARHGRGAADRARPLRRARLRHRLLRQRRLRRAVRRGLRPRPRHAVDRPRRAARTCCSSTPR